MKLTDYEHKTFTFKPNKLQLKPVEFSFSQAAEFNEIYQYVKENFERVEPTKSGAIPTAKRLHSRYMICQSHTKIELVIVCREGCYRFLIGNKRNTIKNPISGKKALREIYKVAKQLNLDLTKYKVDKDTGLTLKNEIEKPHIEMYGAAGIIYSNVHHLDFNSSHWSRLIETYNELTPIAEYMYSKRKENNNYYKHVLTNSYGCMQSVYCPDYDNPGKLAPYQFAGLSKIMCNGTKNIVEKYVKILQDNNRKILLTNTDGIWYQGELFHDENEGDQLGKWENDHKNCMFIMKSKGAYQYVENGKCHTVVRGTTELDKEKERDDWEFGEIFNHVAMEYYEFNEEQGVIKHVKEI